MKVTISIPASDAKQTAELQAALEGYLFEFEIVQSAPPAGMPSLAKLGLRSSRLPARLLSGEPIARFGEFPLQKRSHISGQFS
jgi:hypothetical protein